MLSEHNWNQINKRPRYLVNGQFSSKDFEGVTANTLCRVIETVEGGGAVVLLLQSIDSLKQLYTLCMDVHARYRTHSHQEIVPRFNER